MAIDRTEVVKAEFLEQRTRHEHALGVFFPAFEEAPKEPVAAQTAFGAFAHGVERAAGHQAREHLRQGADVLADRHLVVVEDHQQIRIEIATVMQRFVCHAAGQTAVADHRDDLACVPFALCRKRHAERGGNRCGRMADAEGIELAFLAFGKRCEAILLLDRGNAIAAASEDLVRVALVTDIPDQPVGRRVVKVMQGHGQFDHAQAGAEMTAGGSDRFDQVLAQLACDLRQFVFVEFAQVGRRIDFCEARIALGIDH